MTRRWVGVVSLLLLAAPATAAGPTRTIAKAEATITAFAQDGDFLSWSDGVVVRCGDQYVVHNLRGKTPDRGSCGDPAARQIAVANGAAIWWKAFTFGGLQYHDVVSMPISGLHDLALRREWPRGWTVQFSLVGDGRLLGYGTAVIGPADPTACRASGESKACHRVIKEGGFYRVRGTRSLRVPGLPPVRLATSAAGRIALVPAGSLGGSPARASSVLVYDPSAPPKTRRLRVRGDARAVAFDGRRVAVLVRGALIVWSDLRRSSAFKRYRVAASATALGMSRYAIVYRVGRSIRIVGRGEVAHAAALPIGLSIDGRRIAWAENVNGRGRIQAITLTA
jgi:hypothetical protein